MKFRSIYLLLPLVLVLSAVSIAQPSPTTAADLVKQGQTLNNEGKQDEAIALYQQAVHLDPGNFDAYLNGGIALDLKGEYAEARHHFAKAIELASPENKQQALRAMAISYAFAGNASEAARYEQQVFDARLGKGDYIAAAETANELARIELECGDIDNSYKWYTMGYQTALRKSDLSEADKSLWLFRWESAQARIAARRGQKDEAQKHVAAARVALDKANNPDQLIFFPYLTGYVAFYAGDYKTAIADLQKANQRDPLNLALLAQAYEKSGDKAMASEHYKKVLTSNGHNPTNAYARPLAKKKIAEGM